MIWTVSVRAPWFDYICQGHKTVEGRLKRGIFVKLQPTDTVIWQNRATGKECRTLITRIQSYDSFSQMLRTEGLAVTLPSIDTIEGGLQIYHTYFSPADEKKYGVIALGLKIIK